MRGSFLNFRLIAVLAGMALGAVVSAHGQGPPSQRYVPIQVADPNQDTVSSNLSQLTMKNSALKNLEEDLKKPFEFFDNNDPLNGVSLPPMRQPAGPVVRSKRAKELLERRRDWYLLTPEEMLGVPKAEDIFKAPKYGPDGAEEKEKSPLERFYDRLDNAKAGGTNRVERDSLRGLMSALEGLGVRRAGDGLGASSN